MKAERQRVSTGASREPIMGYCRAIRIGDAVEVSGTAARQNGGGVGAGDPDLHVEIAAHAIGSH